MKAIDRVAEYKDEDFDMILIKIRKGDIKCGRYAHLVKIDKNKIIKAKELFANGKEDNSSE